MNKKLNQKKNKRLGGAGAVASASSSFDPLKCLALYSGQICIGHLLLGSHGVEALVDGASIGIFRDRKSAAAALFAKGAAMGKHENGYARIERDFYPTPAWVTAALAEHIELAGLRVWECACGDGRMVEALEAAGATVYATDVKDRGCPGFAGKLDFVATAPQFDFDAIVTNPAYGERNKLAEKFVEAGLRHIASGGFLALLLPNDFDSGVTRRHLFAECPAFVGKIVLTRRVKWFEPPPGERKKSPKENHSWFLWRSPKSNLQAPPRILYAPRRNGAVS